MDRRTYDRREAWGLYQESSVRVPNFHQLLKTGARLPINPYSWYRIDGQSPLALTYNGPRTEREARGFSTFGVAATDGYFAEAYRSSIVTRDKAYKMAENRLLSKIRNQDIDLGVSVGEFRETAQFVSQALVSAAKAVRQLRRGDVYGAFAVVRDKRGFDQWRDVPDATAKTWLAYKYALTPLMSDVYGAVEAVRKGREAYKDIYTARTSTSIPISCEVSTYNGWYKNSCKGRHRVKGEVRFRVANPMFRVFDQLGLTNPAAIAWELVPLSFVADWFLPIGETLRGVMPPMGIDFVDGWMSCRSDGVATSHTDIPGSPGSPGWLTNATSVECLKHRQKLSSLPRYNVIVPDLSLDKHQLASGMALLYGAFRDKLYK